MIEYLPLGCDSCETTSFSIYVKYEDGNPMADQAVLIQCTDCKLIKVYEPMKEVSE